MHGYILVEKCAGTDKRCVGAFIRATVVRILLLMYEVLVLLSVTLVLSVDVVMDGVLVRVLYRFCCSFKGDISCVAPRP